MTSARSVPVVRWAATVGGALYLMLAVSSCDDSRKAPPALPVTSELTEQTTAAVVAVALAALVIIGVLIPDQIGRPLGQALPLLLLGSVALLSYALYLRSTHPKALATTQPSHSRAQAIVLLTLGLLGLVWAVGLHAYQVGKRTATDIVANLPAQPAVVLYSAERIAVAGTGVEVAEITQPGSKYRYQYSGIRLLARSTDKYLLLPVDWQRGRDRVFVIPDDDSIRIDIAAK